MKRMCLPYLAIAVHHAVSDEGVKRTGERAYAVELERVEPRP